MCLGIPAHVIDPGTPPLVPGTVDVAGQQRPISFAYLPEATAGDWVLIRGGHAITLLDEDEARDILAAIEDNNLFDATVLPGFSRTTPTQQ